MDALKYSVQCVTGVMCSISFSMHCYRSPGNNTAIHELCEQYTHAPTATFGVRSGIFIIMETHGQATKKKNMLSKLLETLKLQKEEVKKQLQKQEEKQDRTLNNQLQTTQELNNHNKN
ncbi:hypothetical protein E2C01_039111 [Portunus trituberculatus]|uniref:Uncharacterized protein n=1 Tax=Portunus trituberculatus TaxID=210409 RepID=A0A5B7FJU3_PORTR|nr:hypothetical protein [Portunus trituberculatus]